jgi:hypothetical protein
VSESSVLAEPVRTVLKREISRLFGDSDPKSFNKKYLSRHSSSVPQRLAGEPLRPAVPPVSSQLCVSYPTAESSFVSVPSR